MGKIKKSFSGFGFKEFMYFVFILSTMYYFPFKLYKECESIDYSLEDAAKAMYLFIIPIMVCLVTFVYSSITGEKEKVIIFFVIMYVFTFVMPYMTIPSVIILGIGYIFLVFLSTVLGGIIYEAIGKKSVKKVNDMMDKSDEKNAQKHKAKMATKLARDIKKDTDSDEK